MYKVTPNFDGIDRTSRPQLSGRTRDRTGSGHHVSSIAVSIHTQTRITILTLLHGVYCPMARPSKSQTALTLVRHALLHVWEYLTIPSIHLSSFDVGIMDAVLLIAFMTYGAAHDSLNAIRLFVSCQTA